MSRLSNMNTRYSTDNPTKGKSDELHLTGIELAQILTLLPERMIRTRFLNNQRLEPMPEIPAYINLPVHYPLFQTINDRILDNHDNDDYEIIPIKTSIKTFLNNHEFSNDLKVGNYSATDRKNHKRYVVQIPYTITECAREYIRICEFCAGKKLRAQYSKHKDIVRAHPVHYFSGFYEGNLAYIDLKAAYWSILWPTTLDMEYDPINQEIAMNGKIPYVYADQFVICKEIRQLIHSLFNYRTMRVWKWDEKRIRHQFPPSELYRPYNVWYIYDVMNAIVTDVANNFTLLQWLTDAAIVPANQADGLLDFLFEKWILLARIIATGPGMSNQTNMYKVGTKQTAHFDPNIRDNEHIRLRNANVEGLRMERWNLIH